MWASAKSSSAITAREPNAPADPGRRRASSLVCAAAWAAAGASLVTPFLAWPARAQAAAEGDADLIARAERYFDEIETLQSRFIQTNPDGTYVDGTIRMKRPGRMRIDYHGESPIEVIADGTFFILVDHRLEEVTYLPLETTPAHLLLREDFVLGEEVAVAAVDRGAGLVRLRLQRVGEEQVGAVTVTLNADPMQLRQWVIEDAQGQRTRVTLLDPRFGVTFDDELFEFENPYGPRQPGNDR